MKKHKYRVKAQEVTTHTFTINANEKDDAEEIAYNVLHGKQPTKSWTLSSMRQSK